MTSTPLTVTSNPKHASPNWYFLRVTRFSYFVRQLSLSQIVSMYSESRIDESPYLGKQVHLVACVLPLIYLFLCFIKKTFPVIGGPQTVALWVSAASVLQGEMGHGGYDNEI